MVLASESWWGDGEGSVHASLVAAAAAAGGGRRRAGVWSEHSYARAAAPPAAPTRLLAPHPATSAPSAGPLVVDDEPAPPPALPLDEVEPEPAADDDDEPTAEAEARAASQAPSAAHGRLLARALHILQDLRLARLAAPLPRSRALSRDLIKDAALKLRRALAPAWWWGGAAWLVGALPAVLGRGGRAALGELLGELRRDAPRLGARLPPAAAPPPDPLAPPAAAPPPPARADPLLLWVSAGRVHDDERWERRLRCLLPTRVVAAPPPPPPSHSAPDRWVAALAADTRAALHDALLDAGGRPVVLCGFGAGASLAAALSGGAGVAGAALLGGGPGAVGAATEGGALLLVLGGGAAGRAAGAAAAAQGGRRRLVVVEGADAALRLPPRLRRRLRLPQAAIDAAVVEEVYRWAVEVADAELTDGSDAGPDDDDEFVHLPPVTSPLTPPPPAPHPHPPPPQPALTTPDNGQVNTRSIEIVEGRVVTRVSGGTPLQLMPRRAPAPSPSPGPAPATSDIMNMPIVFADDEPAPAPVPAPATDSVAAAAGGRGRRDVCVVAGGGSGGGRGGGALQYTRVIVAKRGGGAVGPPPPRPPPPPAAAAPPAPRPRAARPVLLRRAHAMVPRPRPRHPPPQHARRY